MRKYRARPGSSSRTVAKVSRRVTSRRGTTKSSGTTHTGAEPVGSSYRYIKISGHAAQEVTRSCIVVRSAVGAFRDDHVRGWSRITSACVYRELKRGEDDARPRRDPSRTRVFTGYLMSSSLSERDVRAWKQPLIVVSKRIEGEFWPQAQGVLLYCECISRNERSLSFNEISLNLVEQRTC